MASHLHTGKRLPLFHSVRAPSWLSNTKTAGDTVHSCLHMWVSDGRDHSSHLWSFSPGLCCTGIGGFEGSVREDRGLVEWPIARGVAAGDSQNTVAVNPLHKALTVTQLHAALLCQQCASSVVPVGIMMGTTQDMQIGNDSRPTGWCGEWTPSRAANPGGASASRRLHRQRPKTQEAKSRNWDQCQMFSEKLEKKK